MVFAHFLSSMDFGEINFVLSQKLNKSVMYYEPRNTSHLRRMRHMVGKKSRVIINMCFNYLHFFNKF